MQTVELKITKIGNSRGVRIPAGVLRQYAFLDAAIMVTGVDGILLRPKQGADAKMSWSDTAKSMAAASEDWSDWRSCVCIRCAGRPAEIAVDQIRTISKQCLRNKLDALSDGEASTLRRTIVEMYGE